MLQLVKSDAGIEIVNRAANDLRKNHPSAIVQKNANRPRHIAPTVALQIGQQRTQVLRQHAVFLDEILAGEGASYEGEGCCSQEHGLQRWSGLRASGGLGSRALSRWRRSEELFSENGQCARQQHDRPSAEKQPGQIEENCFTELHTGPQKMSTVKT